MTLEYWTVGRRSRDRAIADRELGVRAQSHGLSKVDGTYKTSLSPPALLKWHTRCGGPGATGTTVITSIYSLMSNIFIHCSQNSLSLGLLVELRMDIDTESVRPAQSHRWDIVEPTLDFRFSHMLPTGSACPHRHRRTGLYIDMVPCLTAKLSKTCWPLEGASDLIQLAFSFTDEETSSRKVKPHASELKAGQPQSQLGLWPKPSTH